MPNILGRSPDHGFDEPLSLLSDCHRRIERFLAVLVRVAREFEGRALTPEARDAVHTARRYFAQAAPRHTADEEESLFPRMQAAAASGGPRCDAIRRLEADHQEAGRLQSAVDGLLERWLAGTTLRPGQAAELRDGLQELQSLYREHIRVEDTEVFPLAAKVLTADQIAQVGREMRDRRGIKADGHE